MFSVICIALYPLPAGQSLTSLIRIAALWSDGRLDIGDIDVAYREYIFQIWQDFGKHLSGDLQQGQEIYSKDDTSNLKIFEMNYRPWMNADTPTILPQQLSL